MDSRLRRLGRRLQERLERAPGGSCIQGWIWRARHWYRRGWAEDYLKTVDHPHRAQIVEAAASFQGIGSILEIGCASGANLIRLRARLPSVHLVGVDINRKAIAVAKQYFSEREEKNVHLLPGKADCLRGVADQSVDLVITDAVLMFITPARIGAVMSECRRVARRGMIINEYHLPGGAEGRYEGGRWVHDLVARALEVAPAAQVTTSPSAFTGGAWDEFGRLIEVRW